MILAEVNSCNRTPISTRRPRPVDTWTWTSHNLHDISRVLINYILHCDSPKKMARFPQDIAHVYVILHCNHFIILSKGTNCEITTRDLTNLWHYSLLCHLAAAENQVWMGGTLGKSCNPLFTTCREYCPCHCKSQSFTKFWKYIVLTFRVQWSVCFLVHYVGSCMHCSVASR